MLIHSHLNTGIFPLTIESMQAFHQPRNPEKTIPFKWTDVSYSAWEHAVKMEIVDVMHTSTAGWEIFKYLATFKGLIRTRQNSTKLICLARVASTDNIAIFLLPVCALFFLSRFYTVWFFSPWFHCHREKSHTVAVRNEARVGRKPRVQ